MGDSDNLGVKDMVAVAATAVEVAGMDPSLLPAPFTCLASGGIGNGSGSGLLPS